MSDLPDLQRFEGGTALISRCGCYRFKLTRTLGESPKTACFIMLNPSTADAQHDDPTIRRCIGFARRWGCGKLVVVNLFAYRSTDPRELRKVKFPEGFRNFEWVEREVKEALGWGHGGVAVAAWGANGRYKDQDQRIMRWFDGSPRPWGTLPEPKWPISALHLTKSGDPGHPLYLPADSELVPYVGRPTAERKVA